MADSKETPALRSKEAVGLKLEEFRRRIDQLDAELVRLLIAREAAATEIGRLKDDVGIDTYQPTREQEVLARVRSVNTGPLDPDAITRLFERIIDESRRLERHADRDPERKDKGSQREDEQSSQQG